MKNNQLSIFVNGVLESSLTIDTQAYPRLTPGADVLEIGHSMDISYGSGDDHFDGEIDDLRIYSTSLTEDEVEIIYINENATRQHS